MNQQVAISHWVWYRPYDLITYLIIPVWLLRLGNRIFDCFHWQVEIWQVLFLTELLALILRYWFLSWLSFHACMHLKHLYLLLLCNQVNSWSSASLTNQVLKSQCAHHLFPTVPPPPKLLSFASYFHSFYVWIPEVCTLSASPANYFHLDLGHEF